MDDWAKILCSGLLGAFLSWIVSGMIHGRKLCETFCPWIKAQGTIETRLGRAEHDIKNIRTVLEAQRPRSR